MIAIINITEKEKFGTYGKGVQLYQVQINDKFICRFEHNFTDGLSICLEKAAKAVLTI